MIISKVNGAYLDCAIRQREINGGIRFSACTYERAHAYTQRARRLFDRENGHLKRTDGPTEVKWKLRSAIFEELVGARSVLLKRNAR